MYRKIYPGLALLAGLLVVALVAAMSTTADARGAVTRAKASIGRTSQVSAAPLAAPEGTSKSRVVFSSRKGTFNGVFVPRNFDVRDGHVFAQGTVAGKVHRYGHAARWVVQPAEMQVKNASVNSTHSGQLRAAAVSCNILHLVLGPLDLNLLGLAVHLNTVVLDITAIPGAGNLLGNLLCAVAGLLDGGPLGGLLAQLADLLNQILGAIGLAAPATP